MYMPNCIGRLGRVISQPCVTKVDDAVRCNAISYQCKHVSPNITRNAHNLVHASYNGDGSLIYNMNNRGPSTSTVELHNIEATIYIIETIQCLMYFILTSST